MFLTISPFYTESRDEYSSGCLNSTLTRPCSDLNSIIMDYLVNEGYPAAAQKFAIEAGIPFVGDTESIQQRVDIRNAIHAGELQLAIERIDELDRSVSRSFASLDPCLAMIIRVSCTTQKPPGSVDKQLTLQSSV